MVLLGLLLGGWTLGAGWLALAARGVRTRADTAQRNVRRLARMIDEAPAQLLVVRVDGRIEGSTRLAAWLGFERLPQYLTELEGTADRGLAPDDLARLSEAVLAVQRSSRPFRMSLSARGSRRSLALAGNLADPRIAPAGSAQIWVFDNTDSDASLARMRSEATRARADFAALVGLIEAAPMPMWFRARDGALRLVNSAYVRAVGAASGEAAVAGGIELLERVDGQAPAEVALAAAASGTAVERLVPATIDGQRRALRVTDLPLGEEGIAGYAIDVEEMEELARALKAFREAQRSMLDLLSAGVAQFDRRRTLTFANQPFQRILGLTPADLTRDPVFERLIDVARQAARVPEVRDYPAWRREKIGWFAQSEAQDEAWPLSDGTHLRIVAQPMPDGGLLVIAEDRTETLRISAMRDTLLRTRTATFDSLSEAVAVFAPDGRLQLWNRRFASAFGLESELLDAHPRIADILDQIAGQMAPPAQTRQMGDVVRAATLERRQSEARVILVDGRRLAVAGVPLPDGNGLLTVLDITDQQKAEDALRERNAALVEADQLKTRFLANMSYEFRTPLTSIGGFAELLEAGLGGDLSEGGREYVGAILTSVARLTEQIETVLDLSQSEAGMLPLAMEPIEVLPFVRRLVEDRAAAIAERGLTLELRGDKGAGQVRGDPRRLARALGHLIDNAIAATPEKGAIRIDLTRRRVAKRDLARITIADTGVGMDAPALARALEGTKLANDGKAVDRRQGLGLPLARQLIEAHGGTLELQSRPGKGTTAIVELP